MTDTPQDTPTPGDPDTTSAEATPETEVGRNAAGQAVDSRGKYIRTIDTARRDAQIAEQRSRSWTWRQIAAHHGMAISSCHEAYHRALAEVVQPAAEEARKTELEKLDRLEARVLEVLERRHLTVSHGRVISVDDVPLEDDGPAMQAAATLMRISESRRKLLGLDAPAQVVSEGTVRYEVVGIAPEDMA